MDDGIVGLFVDIVECLQIRLAALIIGIAYYLDLHVLEVHLRRGEVGCRTYLIRTGMESVTGNKTGNKIDTCIAVDGIERQMKGSQIEGKPAYVQLLGIIAVTAYVRQDVGRQILRSDIHA